MNKITGDLISRFLRQSEKIDLVDKNFLSNPLKYIIQCFLASLTLFTILIFENALFSPVIVVAVASSAFTIFIFPHRPISTPRKVVGGHTIAIITSMVIIGLNDVWGFGFTVGELGVMGSMLASLSVGISSLVMVLTNTEHPPAAGTAFGLVIYPISLSAILFIISTVIILSVVKRAMRSSLIDLV